MIASHDSLTYMRARWLIMELFAFSWRTQTKDIEAQRQAGVTHLDIRVRRIRHGRKKGCWRVCHGLVDFPIVFQDLGAIAAKYGDFGLRIILERGDARDFDREIKEFPLAEKYPNIKFLGIKKGWRVILNRELPAQDHCFTPFLSSEGLYGNLKRILRMAREDLGQLTIKGWARRHPLPAESAEDEERLYFADMI